MDLRIIFEQELKKSRIQVLNIGGLIIDRQFQPSLYLAPYAPQKEIVSLLKQVPEIDQLEVEQTWLRVQRKLRYLTGQSL